MRAFLIAALALALAAPALAGSPGSGPARPLDLRPNVVVIMTDDQTYADMAAMPLTQSLIGDAGATFTRAFVSYPLCCPSRATFLTGQYAHNHDVRSTAPPEGGVEALDDDHTLPVWLGAAGYDTTHLGKYLNGYGMRRQPRVPPGWTDWHGAVDKSTYQMYGYQLFENGVLNTFGRFDDEDPGLYQTDVLRDKAIASIRAQAGPAENPFFLSLNFLAPHGEVVRPGDPTAPYVRPASRHEGTLPVDGPRDPSFDEADVSDKPPYVRRLKRLSFYARQRIEEDRQARRESLLAVDEAVGAVVAALAETGELANTYVLFTSDNGFFEGQHRLAKGKYLPYEASAHVPLLVRGPGIPAGVVSGELIANTDLAPTIVQATGATPDLMQDGRSVLEYARDGALRSGRAILHEGLVSGSIDRDLVDRRRSAGVYSAIRTERWLFVLWKGGARELYDLHRDPHELRSRHADPRFAAVRATLAEAAKRLRRCRGAACLQPVSVPPPAPVSR